LERRWPNAVARQIAAPVGEYLLFTLAAQLLTLPITLYHFQRISLSAVLVNPLVLPAQPPVMILGGLAVLLGMLWLPAGQFVAGLAWPWIAYTSRVIEWMAMLPYGNIVTGETSLWVVIGMYAVLIGAAAGAAHLGTHLGAQWNALKTALKPGTALAALALASVWVWRAALAAPDGRLHVTLFETSYGGKSGEALLIQTPGGRNLLVNGGMSLTKISDGLGRRLAGRNNALDWLIVTAPSDENLTATARLLERFPARNVLWAGGTHGTRAGRDLQAALAQQALPQTLARAGHTLDLGAGAVLRTLAVSPRGGVFLLEWGNFRLLLPGGVNFDLLEELHNGADVGRVSVLLLADGGYGPANPAHWLDQLWPQATLVSLAANNTAGLPQAETLEALRGHTLLRTDQHGWIEIVTDSERMWVTVERK